MTDKSNSNPEDSVRSKWSKFPNDGHNNWPKVFAGISKSKWPKFYDPWSWPPKCQGPSQG